MNSKEKNQKNSGRQDHNQPTSQAKQNPTSQSNDEKQWDVKPGQKETDPRQQQKNREWEEAQKQQQHNAKDPGVNAGGNQYENDRNQDPTRRDGRQEEE